MDSRKKRKKQSNGNANTKKKRSSPQVEEKQSEPQPYLVSQPPISSPFSGPDMCRDLLAYVFGFLDAKELVYSALVNSQWNEIVFHPLNDTLIWKQACLRKWQVVEEEVILACGSWMKACKTTPRDSMQEAVKMSQQLDPTCTQLFLVHLKLTALPSRLFSLTKLERLSLFGNALTHLPAEIFSLINLQNLWLYHNQLITISPLISSLNKLVSLGLSNNKLTSIPSEICSLTQLKRLELDNNRIQTLPKELYSMHCLGTLYLSKNPMESNCLDLLKTSLNQVTDCDF